MVSVTATRLDPKFKYEVAAHPGGEEIKVCFACGVCTAGCPVSEIDPAYNPRKIIRMVLLGMREEVLKSDLLWLCINCYTCTAHCPQNVKFTNVIGALRDMAVKEGYVHPRFSGDVDEIDRFMLKLRRDMVAAAAKEKDAPAKADPQGLLDQVTGK
ncbi:MAG: 4Fe-4S dicluster domain-containing protein [Firmicutes bacterium]|nr:4Fe-4S dicluster domain-containing protein [Bacillota bacterium]